jgi:hypothetical protein
VLFLSPIAAVIFAIKNWQESKKPFLVYAASTTLSVVLFVYSFSALGGFAMLGMANRMANGEISEEEAAQFMQEQMERMENSGMLSAEEEAELRQMQKLFQDMQEEQGVKTAQEPTITIGGPSPTTAPTTRSRPTVASARPKPEYPVRETKPTSGTFELAPPGFKRVTVSEAVGYVGRRVRVVDAEGVEHRGTLAEADAGALVVERYLRAGTISYEVRTSGVDSILVAYR